MNSMIGNIVCAFCLTKGSFGEALAEFAHSLPKIVVRYVVVYTTKDIMGHLETSNITIEIVVVGEKG